MQGWGSALWPAVVAVALLVLPGVAVLRAMRVRRVDALLLAAPVTVGVLAVAGVLSALIKLPWILPVVLAWLLVAVAAAAGLGRLWHARPGVLVGDWSPWRWVAGRHVDGGDTGERGQLTWVLAGLAVAAVLATVPLATAIGDPASLSQTWDANFHLNAVRWVIDQRDASTLDLRGLNYPEAGGGVYPAAWHAVVSVVVMVTGAPLTTASNTVAVVVAALVWPASVTFATRALGGRGAVTAAAAVLSVGWVAFPASTMSFGVLWPFMLSTAILPAVLGLGALTLTRGRTVGLQAPLLLVVVLTAAVASHPTALLAAVYLGAFGVVSGLWWRWRHLPPVRRRLHLVVEPVVALAVAAGLGLAFFTTAFGGVRTVSVAEGATSAAQGLGEAVLDTGGSKPGFGNTDPAWLLAGAVLLGVAYVLRTPARRWLAVAWLVSVGLYAVAYAGDQDVREVLTGQWYAEPVRLAALVPVTAAPLAAFGLWWLARSATGLFAGLLARRIAGVVPRWRPVASMITVALVAGLVVVTDGLYAEQRRERVTFDYGQALPGGGRNLASGKELAMMRGLDEVLPEDALVAGNPFNGSSLVYALADRDVVFTHLWGGWSDDALELGLTLSDRLSDPAVCELVDRMGITHLYLDEDLYSPDHSRQKFYTGMNEVPLDGLRPVASGGSATVYTIEDCDG